jgi:hypothetical protein
VIGSVADHGFFVPEPDLSIPDLRSWNSDSTTATIEEVENNVLSFFVATNITILKIIEF